MEITGRVTADAKINELKDNRKVVNFSIAINDRFKPKGAEKDTQVTTYVNCSYWINPGIGDHLKKGVLVELFGRIGVNAWNNAEGEAKGSLTFHVNSLKLHGKTNARSESNTGKAVLPAAEEITEPIDDLPF